MITIELRYSEDLVRKIAMRTVMRSIGRVQPILWGLMTIYLVYLISVGNTGLVIGIVGTSLVFALALTIGRYVHLLRSSMRKFREMQNAKAYLELRDDSLTVRSSLGSIVAPSNAIAKILAEKELWFVFLSRGDYLVIPVAGLEPETQMAIRSKFNDWKLNIS